MSFTVKLFQRYCRETIKNKNYEQVNCENDDYNTWFSVFSNYTNKQTINQGFYKTSRNYS